VEQLGIFEHATKVNIYEQTQTAAARQNRKTMARIIEWRLLLLLENVLLQLNVYPALGAKNDGFIQKFAV